jgi:hypothetical protein
MTSSTEQAATLAAAELHHAWFTGLVLALVAHRGAAIAEAFVFRLFRHQHTERFLPGLVKLGLDQLPHAVAAARYHYFSNQLGGVTVEYLEVDARKAWVRFPPPRWIWSGTAICAIPSAVNRAMLRGWYAQNGVTLGNPRLGFVCTGTTVDGYPGLEGYYREYDHVLEPAERLRFVDDERCPPIDPASLPQLEQHAWPALRQAKAYRNYAMEYVRNALPLLLELPGAEDTLEVGCRAGRLVGMQSYAEIAARLEVRGHDAAAFAAMLADLLAAAGDTVTCEGNSVTRSAWRLFGNAPLEPALQELWRAPYAGLLAAHNRFLVLEERSRSHFTIVPGA